MKKKNIVIFMLIIFLTVVACKTTTKAVKTEPIEQTTVEKKTKKPVKTKPKKVENPRVTFAENLEKRIKKGQYDEALKLFDDLSPELSNDVKIKNLKLSILISANKLAEAETYAKNLEMQHPKNVDVLYSQVMLADAKGDEKKKQTYLTKILNVNPKDTRALTSQGYGFYEKKNYRAASQKFIKAIQINPNYVDANIGLAKVYYMENKLDNAEKCLNHVLKLEPNNSYVIAELARVKSETSRVLEAIKDMERATKITPDVPSLWMDLGTYYTQAAKKTQAKNAYSKVIELDPNHYLAYIYRAGINEELGNNKQAISDYRAVCRLYPSYFYAAESLGVLLYEEEEWDESRLAFVNALEKSPTNVSYALMITLCYYKMNREDKAKNFMQNYIKVVDRQKNEDEYFLCRLFIEKIGDTDVNKRINNTKNAIKRNKMKFYLASFYDVMKKPKLSEYLFLEISGCEYPAFFEYRLTLKELKKRNIAPKTK